MATAEETREYKRQWKQRNPYGVNPLVKVCEGCGTSYRAKNRNKKQRFCSVRCSLAGKTGESSRNWQGGKESERKKLMSTSAYLKWRKSVFERDNYTCQECGVKERKMHTDHIEPFSSNPDARMDIDNGRTLCIPCHFKDTFGKEMPKDSLWGTFEKREFRIGEKV